MHRLLALAFALLPLAACSGDSHDEALEESVTVLEDLTDVLADIDDAQAVEEHQPRLDAVVARIEDLDARMKALGEPSPEDQAELQEKYEPRMQAVMERFLQESVRIAQDPELARRLQPTMQALQKLK